MTERERWIVYPLLFLALGAALRDKIIKTTHSQLVTCEALCVVDKDEKPILVLGAERYPELSPTKTDFLQIDSLHTDSLQAGNVAAENIVGHQMRVLNAINRQRQLQGIGRLEAEVVVAKNYVLTDGEHQLPILGKYTEPLLNIYKAITAQYQIQQNSALQKALELRRQQMEEQQTQQSTEEPATEPPAENTPPSPEPSEPAPAAEPTATEEPTAGEPSAVEPQPQ